MIFGGFFFVEFGFIGRVAEIREVVLIVRFDSLLDFFFLVIFGGFCLWNLEYT